MENLSDILKQEAARLSACHKAIRQWPESGEPQELIALWKKNLDFAIEKDFPKADFAKVFVRVFDEANVEVVELDDAVVKVYDRR